MDFVRVTQGLNDKGILVPASELFDHIKDSTKDYYRSIFLYNESHVKAFKEKGTIAGIVDVDTNLLVWDFDSKEDIELARLDAVTLCSRLAQHGIRPDEFVIAFSGNKGYSVELETTSRFTPAEFKTITGKLSEGLATRDSKIVNASRIFRIPLTRHHESGLYKILLTLNQLSELTSDSIKELAKSPDNSAEWNLHQVILSDGVLDLAEEVKPTKKSDFELADLDFKAKPKNLPSCKWMILNGFFKSGNRSHCLMALAAHFKAQGFPENVTYGVLKAAAETQAQRTNTTPFKEEEIRNNIIKVVYGPNWQGKTYACADHDFLRELCDQAGPYKCSKKVKSAVTDVSEMAHAFTDFSINLEKNLVKTGLKPLDEKLMLLTSTSVGLLGAPGSGKTSVALKILANLQEQGSTGLFCSLDMGRPIVFAKMAMNVSGKTDRELINIFRNDVRQREEICEAVIQKYGSFPISFKSGQSVPDIREMILEQQDKRQEKVKLVVIDYLELISGPYSDATANSAHISAQLKDLSTDLETCVITLVQPQKSAGDASTPLLSMRKIKGASALEQNFRTVLSVYREGFSPTRPEDDRFITVNCLKNTLGGLFSIDLSWEGLRGEVRELNSDEEFELGQLRERLSQQKKDEGSGGWE